MKTNKKELTVFALCAYAIPFLMMPLLYICLQNERDTSIFANAQMFYPAAGVMLAFLLAKRPDMPMRFYILHITATALMLAMSVLSAFLPQEGWLNIANFVIIIASVLGWIFLLTEKKDKARRLRSAPARQAADGSCHLRLFPCGQDRYGLSFDGDAGR